MLVYIDEVGFNLMPSSGLTRSPKGPTPILEVGCRYQCLSMVIAVTETGGCYYAIQPQSFTVATVTRFLRDWANEIDYPLLVIWDNASIHRSSEVKAFLSKDHAQLILLSI